MSKLGPHLGRILLKRSLLSHCKAFDLEVRIARFRLWKHWFNARFAKLVQSLQVGVIPLCDVASACDFECCD